MDIKKPKTPTIDSPVWCAACRIRIAPYDRRSVMKGKIYHDECYVKLRQQVQKQTKK
jgi:hypothetical protein